MTQSAAGRAYGYQNAGPSHSQRYLAGPLRVILSARNWPSSARALDYGCGNGWFAGQLSSMGFATVGVDISESGIELAKRNIPNAQFTTNTSLENLTRLGPFDLITCIEVIAHCYTPSKDLETMMACLKPGGMLVLSTPYHGYLKNLVMAVTGKLENHLDTSWSGAYVHFFTPRSISRLLTQAGFSDIAIMRAGRVPALAKSMVLTCRRPVAQHS